MEEKNPIQVADRLFLVLETLASDGPIALADLSRQLALNKSTVHRLLCSLIYMGYVKQDTDTQKYDLSLKILSLSNRLLSRMDILEIVRPHLKSSPKKQGKPYILSSLTVRRPYISIKKNPTRTLCAWSPRWATGFPFTAPVWGKPWPQIWTRNRYGVSGRQAGSYA